MPYIETRDHTRLFYLDAGAGASVVLVSSAWLNSRMWEHQLPALVEHGFRCVAYDRADTADPLAMERIRLRHAGGIDRALMEADMAVRTRDRPKWLPTTPTGSSGLDCRESTYRRRSSSTWLASA